MSPKLSYKQSTQRLAHQSVVTVMNLASESVEFNKDEGSIVNIQYEATKGFEVCVKSDEQLQ